MVRWVGRVLAGLLLIAVAALLVRIVPAHLQIRRVAPRLPSREELRTLLAVPGEGLSLS